MKLGGASPLRQQVAGTSSEPQGGGREANAERSGERKSEPTHRNRMRGGAKRGEQATDCKAPATKDWRRRFGGCGWKVSFLTWGDLVLGLKGPPMQVGDEESAKAIVFHREMEEGPNRKRTNVT